MRIGIDIDDTITESWNFLIPFFSSWFDVDSSKLVNSSPYYNAVKDKCSSVSDYFDRVNILYDNVLMYAPIKNGVRDILYKLHENGFEIVFITARGRGYSNAYALTKKYLEDNGIYYDKLLIGNERKDKACLDNNIDIFIDDSFKHCLEVKNVGVDVIMMDAEFNKDVTEFNKMSNWVQIYEYIMGR